MSHAIAQKDLSLFPSLEEARSEFAQSVARIIANEIIPSHQNGFTFDPWSLSLPRFRRDVYIVSLEGHGCTVSSAPSELLIALWIQSTGNVLELPCHYIGGWPHENLWHMDVSIPVRGESAAIQVAIEQKQSCVYHPATCGEIWIPQVDRKAA